ncbi:MAG: hypothetical protein O3B41_04080 [Bacteroidetes bacterium]|nr:hypothetical protein [Bacteroidota bacterium]
MASDTTDRREKMVMGLGIITIILFSANLMTAVANYFWPNYSLPWTERQDIDFAEDEEGILELHFVEAPHYKHRMVIRHRIYAPEVNVEVFSDEDIEREVAELERTIRMEVNRLTSEIAIGRARPDRVERLK